MLVKAKIPRMMSYYLRKTATGQIARVLSGNRVFRYPEEEPNSKIPWEQTQAIGKQAEIGAPAGLGNIDLSSSDNTPHTTPAVDAKTDPIARPDEDPEQGLDTIPTQA